MFDKTNLKYVWQFKIATFAQALELQIAHNNSRELVETGGFNSSEWRSKQIEMLQTSLIPKLPRNSSLPDFLPNQNVDNLFDLGGGPGWIWAYLVKSGRSDNLTYFNLELESSGEAFQHLTSSFPGMRFIGVDDLKNYSLDANLLYSNSVLQYFEDNIFLVKMISELNPVLIVLDDVAGGQEEFYSLQNYYGYMQVNRFINFERLISEVCNLGYRLTLQKPYEKIYSESMTSKIWLGGESEVVDCAVPSSVTLIFNRI